MRLAQPSPMTAGFKSRSKTDVTAIVPERLALSCGKTVDRQTWLKRLPETLRELQELWVLSLAAPFDGAEVSCAWVAPAICADGRRAVLKLGMPHMEGEHEIDGLRFWGGEPMVHLLEADDERNAMLLERCEPGSTLRHLPEPQQDEVVAGILRRLWRRPPPARPFLPLSTMTSHWAKETIASSDRWPDPGLVLEGLGLFEQLTQFSPDDVLLATDLHAGNVLSAQREPWLAIDPKPFLGDRAYDATQHLFNCEKRLRADPIGTIRRLADLLEIDYERISLWMFARAAAEPRDNWDDDSMALARALSISEAEYSFSQEVL
jgi:streptomycin 6-kinase